MSNFLGCLSLSAQLLSLDAFTIYLIKADEGKGALLSAMKICLYSAIFWSNFPRGKGNQPL